MPITATFCLLAALGAPAQEPSPAPFPASTATAEGVSAQSLARLDRLVQTLVDEDEVVGAELLVIKNGRSILHQAYGWRDREAEVPMTTGSVFCVRSMTKPLIGAAVLMLVEEGLLQLDAPVASYLPAFDVDGSREITVEHLLTHTSGLPMSLILGRDLRQLDGIQAVAGLGAGRALDFDPGSAFQYSDQGTDTLTAIVEVVSGVPAADFVRARLLEPLGMRDSACLMREGHPLRARGCSKYAGVRGDWTRFWSADDPPLFPFFLGSQGLYSTLPDYARFLGFWLRGGRAVEEKLLDARLVRRALTPGPFPLGGSTGLPGLASRYGFLMQLWAGPGAEGAAGAGEVVAFGHTGSDGTHAWVFPEQEAMALYFTQSRGTLTGLRVEEALGELFLGAPVEPVGATPPLTPYLGYYREHDDDSYRAIVLDGAGLALEIHGKAVVPLVYLGEDRWKLQPDPSKVLAFDRAPTGEVTGYRVGDHQEHRFEPSEELPDVEELGARVAATHRLDLLESLGPMRINSQLTLGALDLQGEVSTLYAWPDRFRVDAGFGEEWEMIVFDGERVSYAAATEPAAALEGPRAEMMRLGNHFARFGDWRRWHARMQVIQQLQRGGKEILLVRAGDTSAPAPTFLIDLETGRVLGEESMILLPGLGRIGQQLRFGDFRDVSGMLLPFQIKAEIANSMIGALVTTVTEIELGVELSDRAFELGE
ncbi:MAG: beta-lactamase family protein [Planctomycetes bacterium]|nr:beta-lactamase family protein [Planctomycetota bacterium]